MKNIVKKRMSAGAACSFFVANVQGKNGDIGGYMPLQRQAGFIYDLPNNELIAHELAHGAFNLRHTFSFQLSAFFDVAKNCKIRGKR
ncbi:MAG: hypothetical protein LBG15_09710 [Dysgonamonadaceae bacterium]|jgi:hypothetical protein|nr:hypothetical protein [Dysgonamonadaceae bacterium]